MEGVLVIKTCLPNFTASSTEGVLVITNVSVKISASLMEGVLVIKKVSVKLFSFFIGGIIGDQERVCQTLSASLMDGVLMIKNVSVKLFSFNWGGIAKRVCQILQFLQRVEYWWWRTCLSNSSVSSVEAVLVILSVHQWKWRTSSALFNGFIGDQESVCCSLMEGVLVRKNVSSNNSVCAGVLGSKLFKLLQWREYWWSRTCLSNSSASLLEGVLVIKNVSVKLFSFINGGSIGDQERVCQTLQLLQWKDVLMIKKVSLKLVSFINGGSIGDEERACQTRLLI